VVLDGQHEEFGKEKKCNEIVGLTNTWVMNTKNKSNNIKNIKMFLRSLKINDEHRSNEHTQDTIRPTKH